MPPLRLHVQLPVRWLALVLLLASATVAQAGDKIPAELREQATREGHVRVLVMLEDEAPGRLHDAAERAKRSASVQMRVTRVLDRLPAAQRRPLRRFHYVPAFAIEADAALLERLATDPDVRRVDVDAPGRGGAVAPDESSVLNNVSPLVSMGLNGTGLKVAVIDSGLDTDHVDLAPRLVAQQCYCSGGGGCCPNGNATQSGAGSAEDGHGHGTNVTGIVMGQGNVAPRGAVPGVDLVAVRVLDNNNSFCCTSDVVAAMDWVAFNHPDVDAVNMSVGTGALFAGSCNSSTSFTQALSGAANVLIGLGAVITSSAGNQGNSNAMSAPACVTDVVGVGATWDFTGGPITFLGCTETSTAPKQPACFSNRSVTTDLYGAGAMVLSTGRNGGTSNFGGTSMAAPMAAGCAIALKQAAPASTVAQRNQALVQAPTTVTDIVSGRSYPFLDCVHALDFLTASFPPTLSLSDASVIEGNGGARSASFAITLSKPATGAGVSLSLSTTTSRGTGNTATAGSDYVPASAVPVHIPAGQSTASFSVKVLGDRRREADEVFRVGIDELVGAEAVRGAAQGLILDDDSAR